MASASHITFEKSRERWVFQLRIPKALRSAFDERTTIRIALGRVPEAEAKRKAAALAQEWKARFARVEHKRARVPPAMAQRCVTVRLRLDEDTATRAVATSRALQLQNRKERLDWLRQSDERAWEAEVDESAQTLRTAKWNARRAESGAALAALDELGCKFAIEFEATASERTEFVEAFNVDAVRLAAHWLTVLDGTARLEDLAVSACAMLPLTRIFGTRAAELAALRRARIESIGKVVRPKTDAKFERIARQLDDIMGERPVQLLRECDVAALVERWRHDDNRVTTVVDKLQILAGMLRPISEAAVVVCHAAVPSTAIARVGRNPFSVEQLCALRTRVAQRDTHGDDVRLVELMILTGARLGEILQLTATHMQKRDARQYVVSFGLADEQLKTPSSMRDVPISTAGFDDLEAWLERRRAAGGALFADARPDRYGHYGNAQSKRINRLLRTMTADRRIVLQSTRNTVGQALRRAGIDPRVRRRFLGHADIDIHDKYYDPSELLGADDLLGAVPVMTTLALASRPDSDVPGVP